MLNEDPLAHLFVRPPLTGGVHRILSNPMNEDAEPRLINRGMSRLITPPFLSSFTVSLELV